MEGREHSTQSSGPLISPATRQGLAHPSRHDCPNSQQSLLRRCPVGRSQLIIRSTMYLASGSAGSAGVCALIAATLRWWPRLTRNERERPPCFGRNLRTSMIRPKPPRCRATASGGISARPRQFRFLLRTRARSGSNLCRTANPCNSRRPPLENRRSISPRTAAGCTSESTADSCPVSRRLLPASGQSGVAFQHSVNH